MILVMNVGNTNFTVGLKDINYTNVYKYPSNSIDSCDDFKNAINISIRCSNIKHEYIKGIIISSVNPTITDKLMLAAYELFSLSPTIVRPIMNMKLNLSNYDTKLIGSDRIAICEAAVEKYTLPIIVFDFGTATTINVIDSSGYFLGGSILAGVSMGLDALKNDTAQLPHTILSDLPFSSGKLNLIGHNTNQCLISGALFGNAAMLDGMTERIESLLGQKTNIILTGGNAKYIIPLCRSNVIHEPELLIDGSYLLYLQNS